MRKNDLIKLLQEIDGNPQIVFWNGYVDDYMNISAKAEKITLVKETEEFIRDGLAYQWCEQHQTFDIPNDIKEAISAKAKIIHKERQWDFPNEYVTEDEFERWYGKKTLTKYVLSPTLRGKTSLGMCSAQDLKY